MRQKQIERNIFIEKPCLIHTHTYTQKEEEEKEIASDETSIHLFRTRRTRQ